MFQGIGPILVSWYRFIYVRHGSSLVKEGTKLLHLLSSVFVIIYIVNRNFHAVRARAVADT